MTDEEYNYQVQQEIDKVLARLKNKKTKECSNPQCRYENIGSNSYCVKCGWLLPGCSRKVVINRDEYEELKMSGWDKIKKSIF